MSCAARVDVRGRSLTKGERERRDTTLSMARDERVYPAPCSTLTRDSEVWGSVPAFSLTGAPVL